MPKIGCRQDGLIVDAVVWVDTVSTLVVLTTEQLYSFNSVSVTGGIRTLFYCSIDYDERLEIYTFTQYHDISDRHLDLQEEFRSDVLCNPFSDYNVSESRLSTRINQFSERQY